MFYCIKCGKEIPQKSKSKKYCSPRCGKLFLQSQYRKRNKDKINQYNRERNRLGIRGNPSTNSIIASFLERNKECAKCKSKQNLNVCHIKPRTCGGKNKDNLIVLCQKHHYQFDQALKYFWKEK